jgi:hypothetical protein
MPSTMPRQMRPARQPRAVAAALGLWLAALASLPAAAEVKLPSERGIEAPDSRATEAKLETWVGDGPPGRTILRVDSIERSRARGTIVNQTSSGELILYARGRGAVSETVIGTIEDVEAGGAITNTVTIGGSTTIAIGDGARACTEIGTMGRATCR